VSNWDVNLYDSLAGPPATDCRYDLLLTYPPPQFMRDREWTLAWAPFVNSFYIDLIGLDKQGFIDVIIGTTRVGDTVVDPFCGLSLVGIAALAIDRKYIGFDNQQYCIDESTNRLKS